MLRPDLIQFIQDAVEELATEIAVECETEHELRQALQFLSDDILFSGLADITGVESPDPFPLEDEFDDELDDDEIFGDSLDDDDDLPY